MTIIEGIELKKKKNCIYESAVHEGWEKVKSEIYFSKIFNFWTYQCVEVLLFTKILYYFYLCSLFWVHIIALMLKYNSSIVGRILWYFIILRIVWNIAYFSWSKFPKSKLLDLLKLIFSKNYYNFNSWVHFLRIDFYDNFVFIILIIFNYLAYSFCVYYLYISFGFRLNVSLVKNILTSKSSHLYYDFY